MAVWLSGGAARIVLRIEVQQKITDEGHQFIKDQMSRTISDGEIIHWSAQSTGEIAMLSDQLKSFGYKGPEHLDDADIFLGGPFPAYHPKWLQFLEIKVTKNGKLFSDNFPAVTIRDSKIKTVLAPNRNILDLNKVFSLEKNSPGWLSWQTNLEQTLKSGNIFGSEGLAINMSVYIDNLKTEFLPLNCNWIASNLLPKFDESQKTFVEPYLPNYKIGIMHLAAGIWKNHKDMRLDEKVKINIQTLNNTSISKSLRFGH